MSRLPVPTRTFKGSELARARSRIATAARCGTPEEADTARRDHAALRLAEQAQKVADSLPPLTDAQVARIVALLRPAGGGGGAPPRPAVARQPDLGANQEGERGIGSVRAGGGNHAA